MIMKRDLIVKRIWLFIGIMVLSFFIPWQITTIIVILVALLLPTPIEYIYLVIGIFGGGLFSLIWFLVVVFGFFFRDQVRFNHI